MIERRGGASFTAKAFRCLLVLCKFFGKKLHSYEASQFGILGFVNDTHTTASELFDDAVVRDGLADHWAEMLGRGVGQVNEGHEGRGGWRRIDRSIGAFFCKEKPTRLNLRLLRHPSAIGYKRESSLQFLKPTSGPGCLLSGACQGFDGWQVFVEVNGVAAI